MLVKMETIFKVYVKTSLVFGGGKKMSLFSFQKAILNILGFNWFPGGVSLPLPGFVKHVIYPAIYPTLMVTVGVLTLMHVFSHQAVTQNEFIQKINGYIVAMTFFAATFKSIIFMIWRKSFQEMILKVEELGSLDADLPSVKHHLTICLAYTTLVISNPGTWASWGLSVHHDIPFQTSYPWENVGMGFLTNVGIGFITAVFCALCHIMVDTTFQMAVSGITIHLDAVAERLSLLGTGNKFKDHVNLSVAVDQHAQLLRVADYLSRCYSNIFVAQSAYTVVHSCVLLFGALHVRKLNNRYLQLLSLYIAVAVEDKIEVVMNQGTMLATSYMQLLVYCYYGELLTSKFGGLCFASYDNSWYNCSLNIKKGLVKLSLMSHKHISLRGFGNVQPSKSNWLHSLQDSVSYFLFLKTMTGED